MPDSFVIDPSVCDGFPSFGRNFTNSNITFNGLMYIDPDMENFPSFGRPFTMFGINCPFLMKIRPDILDGYPGFKEIQWFKPPYPSLMMTMEEDRHDGMPSYRKISETFAAFKNASLLEQITIPPSVKSIVDYAFYNTNIKSVKISRDCVYGKHSFPIDCVISYY